MPGREALNYRLWPYGEPWDARVDIIGKSVILHSRGGSTGGHPARNTDYTKALTRICENFGGDRNWIDRILIDSAKAHAADETERVLLERNEIHSLMPDELVKAIQQRLRQWNQAPGTKGGNSTKQVRFDLTMRHSSIIQSLVARPEGAAVPPATAGAGGQTDPDETITGATIRALTRAQLSAAVDQLLAGTETHGFSDITDYSVLLEDGTRLPPKAIVGVALKNVLARPVGSRAFRGGDKTPAFAALRDAGFTIIHTRAGPLKERSETPDPPEEVNEILADTPLNDEDRSFAEGSKKRAWHLKTERNPALVREKKKLFEAEHGCLFCEHCKEDFVEQFGDRAIARACFDAHHKSVMVADMAEGHASHPDDLEILCATCHRAEHARLRMIAKGTRAARRS